MIGGAFGKVKDGVIIDEPTIEFLTMHAKTFADFINQEKGAE
jgi:hypothetical protein